MIRRFLTNKSGSPAVEFALMAPLFLFIFFGMIAYGIYLGASHAVQQMAADAARTAVAGIDARERAELAGGYITRNADGYAFVDARRISMTASAHPADPAQFVVAVRYDARDLPIWNLFRGLPLPRVTIERRSSIRAGGI